MNSFEWKYKNIINKRRNKKIAAKTELKAGQDKAVKLQTYDFKSFYWSKVLCQWWSTTLLTTTRTNTDNNLSASIKWYKNSNFCLIFKRSCLKQTKNKKSATFSSPNITFFLLLTDYMYGQEI